MAEYEILLVAEKSIVYRFVDLALQSTGKDCRLSALAHYDGVPRLLEEKTFDLVITDIYTEEEEPFVVCNMVKRRNPLTPVIIFASQDGASLVIESFRAGADDFLLQPCMIRELTDRIDYCLNLFAPEPQVIVQQESSAPRESVSWSAPDQ